MVPFSMKHRLWLAAGAVLGSAMLTPYACLAQSGFPNKVITLVSAFPTGGTTDIVARAIAPPLGQALGVSVIVENRVGAAGMLATDHVAKAKPDGYTLLVTTATTVLILPHTSDTVLPYDAQKDLVGITLMGIAPEVLAVNPKVPATNLKELIALAGKRQVTLASSGTGGLPHLVIELLRSSASGARIVHVPFKGAGPAVIDTLGGHVDGIFVDLPAVATQIKANQLRGITVANNRRSEFLPDLQTSVEQGFPNVIGVNWTGILAPAGTPRPVIDKLHAALLNMLKLDAVKKALALSSVEVSVSATPADFAKFLAVEYKKWAKVVEDAGMKPTR